MSLGVVTPSSSAICRVSPAFSGDSLLATRSCTPVSSLMMRARSSGRDASEIMILLHEKLFKKSSAVRSPTRRQYSVTSE